MTDTPCCVGARHFFAREWTQIVDNCEQLSYNMAGSGVIVQGTGAAAAGERGMATGEDARGSVIVTGTITR